MNEIIHPLPFRRKLILHPAVLLAHRGELCGDLDRDDAIGGHGDQYMLPKHELLEQASKEGSKMNIKPGPKHKRKPPKPNK